MFRSNRSRIETIIVHDGISGPPRSFTTMTSGTDLLKLAFSSYIYPSTRKALLSGNSELAINNKMTSPIKVFLTRSLVPASKNLVGEPRLLPIRFR